LPFNSFCSLPNSVDESPLVVSIFILSSNLPISVFISETLSGEAPAFISLFKVVSLLTDVVSSVCFPISGLIAIKPAAPSSPAATFCLLKISTSLILLNFGNSEEPSSDSNSVFCVSDALPGATTFASCDAAAV